MKKYVIGLVLIAAIEMAAVALYGASQHAAPTDARAAGARETTSVWSASLAGLPHK